ncbi:MAG: helix-turn-helix domain-containing protein [Clostridia bacterium]|nr:helix-turn-helix domain-containing protein [Clostridia bacterium]
MDLLADFAEILRDLILERNMNAKQFAIEIGAQNSSVSEYLHALRLPKVARLVEIANYFNCSTDYLLGLEEDRNSGNYCVCPPFHEQLNFLKKYFQCSNSYLYTDSEIPKTRYYDWLKGKRLPSLENVVRLAERLNCTVDFVIGRNKV